MTRYGPVISFGRALADHDLGRHEAFPALADTRLRHAQSPSATQACARVAAQRATALYEQRLVNGFVTDAHVFVVRKVDVQTARNLLRAPCL
ncbi:MAG: Integrase, catalytic region [Bradyrhizobium sp.]|nr:Integrase, catalytic region [Bradyrhizobium sp.]